MTTLCLITGATVLSLLFGCAILRLGCWAEGREW